MAHLCSPLQYTPVAPDEAIPAREGPYWLNMEQPMYVYIYPYLTAIWVVVKIMVPFWVA